MRHKVAGRHLNRTSAHRNALRRNLAASLFEHGTISTTVEKAKFVKPFAEKLITLARDGSLHARRRAIAMLQDRKICTVEEDEPVAVTTVIQRLFAEIGPRFADRNGGYTRIIRRPDRRIGDNGQQVLLQLVDESTVVTEKAPRQRPGSKESPVPSAAEESAAEEPAAEEPSTAASEAAGEPGGASKPEEPEESQDKTSKE